MPHPPLSPLRQNLHIVPERAGGEQRTAWILEQFLSAYAPDEVVNDLAGHGLAAVFQGEQPGPTILVRAELDAVPVDDDGAPDNFGGMAHRCGHDGHMSIVAGLAPRFRETPLAHGRLVLLFQPAEETGDGAGAVIGDPGFHALRPDFAMALHNVPGFAESRILARRGVFASASAGMEIELMGEPSHAAEPEKARSPADALRRLIASLPALGNADPDDLSLFTITHLQMGQRSFGVTPGHAVMYATCRATTSAGLVALREHAETLVRITAADCNLGVEVRWRDVFPETRNDPVLVDHLDAVCGSLGLAIEHVTTPFRWSDDFGHFANVCPSLYFGIGIGVGSPLLHQLGYWFEDSCIPTGSDVFEALVRRIAQGAVPDGSPP